MKYYVLINGQQTGPVEENQLLGMGVTRDTTVWHEGMPQWQAAGTLPELGYLFANAGNAAGYNYGGGYGQATGAAPQPPMQPMPKTWLVESILVTVFCCIPFGIVGIAYNTGNYILAQEKSKAAKKWTIWGLIAWIVGVVLYVIFWIAMAGLGLMSEVVGY